MSRLKFNVAGPCIPGMHYIVDPMRGIEKDLMTLIDDGQYYVIHAARQTGKTTLLLNFADRINAEGKYYALYCSLEAVQTFTDPKDGIPEIVRTVATSIAEQGLPEGYAKDADYAHISGVLRSSIVAYTRTLDRPLVIFFDEADSLSEDTLITFLRQLRDGYNSRGMVPFARSIALVGLRDLRDYRMKAKAGSQVMSTGSPSPFNIITKSLNLRCFTYAEIVELYAQHTADTGQVFEEPFIDYVFEQTRGQPWLVSAIARECVMEILGDDNSIPVTMPHAEQAIMNIVRDRRTHIDSMMAKLKDPRVRSVIVPMILGEDVYRRSSEDYLYTRDLGIIRENDDGSFEPANPIYSDMIIRTLNWDIQETIKREREEYVIPRYIKDGALDMDFLIRDFQEFWRENSMIWKRCLEEELYIYEEAAPHLVMYAFLQRVINGGGCVVREKPTGKKYVDLHIAYNNRKYPIELKILQNERSRAKSYEQILTYMDGFGADTGWLVIFDRDADKSWDEKIFMKEETVNGKKIVVAGC